MWSYKTPCFRYGNGPAFSLHHGSNLSKQTTDYVIIWHSRRGGNEPASSLYHGSDPSKQTTDYVIIWHSRRGGNEPASSLHHVSDLSKQLTDYVIIYNSSKSRWDIFCKWDIIVGPGTILLFDQVGPLNFDNEFQSNQFTTQKRWEVATLAKTDEYVAWEVYQYKCSWQVMTVMMMMMMMTILVAVALYFHAPFNLQMTGA